MNSTEPQVENLVAAIDDAFKTGIVPGVPTETPSTDVSSMTVPFNPDLKWQTIEEYKSATSKRFRMTKAELAEHGDTEAGRMAAFVARQIAGLLG